MKQITFSVLGDCCIDHFVTEKKTFLGGTAFNVAYHAQKAGAKTTLISAVGADIFGKKYIEACKKNYIATDFLTVEKGDTSSVDIVRKDNTDTHFANWNIGVLQTRDLTEAEKAFLLTQDIARAVLFKPVTQMFESFAKLSLPDTLKVGDFLGSSDYSFRINPIEKFVSSLDIIIKSVEENEENFLNFLQNIATKYNKLVIALLGKKGSVVFDNEKTYQQSTIPTKVVNTTGAGDTYQAHFCYWYKKTGNVSYAMRAATKAAAKTIEHLGASYQKEF